MKIKKGDNVIILTGGDKGKKGTVTRALPSVSKIVVEGVNIRTKHKRARRSGEKGQLVKMALPINASNAKVI